MNYHRNRFATLVTIQSIFIFILCFIIFYNWQVESTPIPTSSEVTSTKTFNNNNGTRKLSPHIDLIFPPNTSYSLSIDSLFSSGQRNNSDLVCTGRRLSNDAIVVLGQKVHSSYDVSHNTSLHILFDSLIKNYAFIKETDVLLWHEGDFNQSDFTYSNLRLRYCDLRLLPSVWGRPHVNDPIRNWKQYSPGYLKMIRFYAVTIWETMALLGYEWLMRFDDDSKLVSEITYNIFDFMRIEKKIYAYRMLSRECGSRDFGTFMDNYVRDNGIVISGARYCHSVGSLGFYNNFYITNVRWWLQRKVQHFVQTFDRSNLIFTKRDNDLIFQTAVVRLFLPKEHVHMFTDWSYIHHTIRNGVVTWGGLQVGSNDSLSNITINNYVSTFFPHGGHVKKKCIMGNVSNVIVQHGSFTLAPYCDGIAERIF